MSERISIKTLFQVLLQLEHYKRAGRIHKYDYKLDWEKGTCDITVVPNEPIRYIQVTITGNGEASCPTKSPS